jgi:hypothetical protein
MRKEVANKDLNELNPEFRKKVDLFLKEVWDKIRVTEWYRSQERQNWLHDQGRKRKGKIVTWTRSSKHTQRIAIDICFRWKNPYPNDVNKWKEIAKVAKKYEIDWLYDLQGRDMPHFQDNGKKLVLMWNYERLFKSWSSKWESRVLENIEWWIKETWIERELAFSLLILFERVNKKTP